MKNSATAPVAIVDYAAGNLFSVQHACRQAGLDTQITGEPHAIFDSPAVILPGVGAFGDAIDVLRRTGLASALIDFAHSGKPLIGICLGMQLLMSESNEFGRHSGLGLIAGDVCRFSNGQLGPRGIRVPHTGWSRIYPPCYEPSSHTSVRSGNSTARTPHYWPSPSRWQNSPLCTTATGEAMYFVHSYYVRPQDADVVLAETVYGDTVFCSAMQQNNIWAFQFHPEKSGLAGIKVYRSIASIILAAHFQEERKHAA